jgi:hypothetical protein
MSTPAPLRFEVAAPCTEPWSAMVGDERARRCVRCALTVFNVSQLDRAEVEALLHAKTGRVWLRFFRRADGTVLTRDCPVGRARLRRRALSAVATMLALVWGVWVFRTLGELSSSAACGTPLNRLMHRAGAMKERLRGTETFGWLIERCTGSSCSRGSVPRSSRGSARDASEQAASCGPVLSA